VEAGLRTADGRREIVQAAWADSQGDLQIKLVLPLSAKVSESWQGLVRVRAGDEFLILSTGSIQVKPGPFTYRVKQGDTLGVIAGWFHTTVSDIMEINPDLPSARRIKVGQILNIPLNSAIAPSLTAKRGYRIPDFAGLDVRQSLVKGVFGEVWEQIQGETRWIEVDLSAQITRAYLGTRLERTFIVSTGRSRTPTVTGQYFIYVKYPATDMSGPGYHLEDVPYTMYFYKGYGLHGTYWHNNFGRPMSHGCVNLSIEDAEWLYRFGGVGTLVYVHP
jgi:LysM repeat protein